MKKLLTITLCLLPLNVFASLDKQYFAVFMDGKKIGHSLFIRQATPQQVVTTTTLDLGITRSEMELHVAQSEICYETPSGKPIGFKAVMDMSGMKQTTTGKIIGDKLQITTEIAGTPQTQLIEWPQGALLAEGLRLAQLEKSLKPGTTYTVKTFAPSTLTAIDANITILAPEKIDLLGRVITLPKAQTTLLLPSGTMTQTSYVDSDLIPQKTIMPAMGFNIELIACDKAFALSKNDVVDFINKSMIQSPVSLKDTQSASSIEYTIAPKSGAKLYFPTTSAQSVAASAGAITLTVSRITPPADVKIPYAGSDPNALNALKPGLYVQSDSPKIKHIAQTAKGTANDAATAATNIEKFVRGYITEKNYSVGYASALEVSKSKEGDCTEHAVFMTALCQAVGIPSRVAFGLLYVDEFDSRKDVFVGHAWTQCLIGDKWIDFDATRHQTGPTRILMATGNGNPDQFFSMVATFGNFTIMDAKIK